MRLHELKLQEPEYTALTNEELTCNVRRMDRDFKVGDFVTFREFDPVEQKYTGSFIHRHINHIMVAGKTKSLNDAIKPGFGVLSLTACDTVQIEKLDAVQSVEKIAPIGTLTLHGKFTIGKELSAILSGKTNTKGQKIRSRRRAR